MTGILQVDIFLVKVQQSTVVCCCLTKSNFIWCIWRYPTDLGGLGELSGTIVVTQALNYITGVQLLQLLHSFKTAKAVLLLL